MVREIQVTIDCADPGALAPFWAEALGYRVQEPPGDFGSWDEALAAMGVPAPLVSVTCNRTPHEITLCRRSRVWGHGNGQESRAAHRW